MFPIIPKKLQENFSGKIYPYPINYQFTSIYHNK